MPNVLVVLPDVYETVSRAVAVGAVQQVAQYMGLPEQTRVLLPGKSDTVAMNDGIFGNCCDAANAVYFDPQEKLVIRYEEIAEENFTLSTSVWSNDNYPIFVDETHDVWIRPIRRFVDFRLDMTYQAPNIVVAQRWLDDQRLKLSEGAGDLTFFLEYHYNVPKPVQSLLRGLHTTMEQSAWPTGKTYGEWLEEHLTQPTTEMATLIDTHHTMAIMERQVDVVGHFDFINTPDTPQPSSDKSGSYEVTFSYICRYDRPTHMYVQYPMVVNQCPIPTIFRPKFPYRNYQSLERKTTALRGSLEAALGMHLGMGSTYIQYPDTDDWQTDDQPLNSFLIFSGLLTLDCKDPRYLMDMRKLGRFNFSCPWVELFDTLGDKTFKGNSWFIIRLYKNNKYINIPMSMERGTLRLMSDVDLDPNYVYHIQILINKNFYSIPRDKWECLRRYPTIFYSLCQLFQVGCGKRPIEDMKMIGLGIDRVPSEECPGEGSTDWCCGDSQFPRGLVKWSEIQDALNDQDKNNATTDPNGGGYLTNDTYGPTNVFYFGLVADKKT
ncbi:hypothetical protein PHABIO_144 [Pseudomonas phage Phabio]|uniref:Uncharacterized protein n=1 Tax=Pseudomonas phage Phabio TaxID=2006668 RepID=A0A1Y0SWC2_9CAUD|nr:hypothetical protein MZD05_gp144 [Pseudomonas phage Phabio]ARV76775.1 hypothetical protein PHABIO_144 [Pseudomonas phage Phabio]